MTHKKAEKQTTILSMFIYSVIWYLSLVIMFKVERIYIERLRYLCTVLHPGKKYMHIYKKRTAISNLLTKWNNLKYNQYLKTTTQKESNLLSVITIKMLKSDTNTENILPIKPCRNTGLRFTQLYVDIPYNLFFLMYLLSEYMFYDVNVLQALECK